MPTLAVDQGTTGTTCLVVDGDLAVLGRGYAELRQRFPRPGWVEHDPEEIWGTVVAAAEEAIAAARAEPDAIAITNQRETTILWERSTGRPVENAIVWQDRRTAERCAELPADLIRARTGLVPDPYFSATKLESLLRGRDPAGLAFGTVDAWLVWKLTGGRVHATDETNASRTMLCSLETLDWDDELLSLFGVPRGVLPEIRPSGSFFGEGELLGRRLPVRGVAGDQQAALFAAGGAKATFGTGAFVLVETGAAAPRGLLRTAAARLDEEPPRRALEGAVFVAGAALQWLRDGLGLIDGAAQSEALAASVPDTGGVYFVPALTGLGSPHWRPDVRGAVSGITRGTTRAHLVRAALEASAYQTADVLAAMPPVEALRVDGGMTRNRWLMQFLADVLAIPVETAAEAEQTALGAALLGLGVRRSSPAGERFEPRDDASGLYAGWREAVARLTS
ncbi:MAG: glycerol kinase GlpK [Acidobacteriota bacterium]|nr:glycerol kinase GlpK [Acidobacteriota bacterium]